MKKTAFSLIIFILCCTVMALAEEKVGYLNMNEAFNNYYKTIRENYNIELRRKSVLEQVDILRNEFQSSIAEYEKLSDDAENELLSETVRNEAARKAAMLEERLQQKQLEYQKVVQDSMGELENFRIDTEERIISDLTGQATKYATDNGYTMVYETSGKSLNRTPFLLIYPKDLEFTEDFIKVINAGHEKEAAEAKADMEKLLKSEEKADESAENK